MGALRGLGWIWGVACAGHGMASAYKDCSPCRCLCQAGSQAAYDLKADFSCQGNTPADCSPGPDPGGKKGHLLACVNGGVPLYRVCQTLQVAPGGNACPGCRRDAILLLILLWRGRHGSLGQQIQAFVSRLSGQEARLRQPMAYKRAFRADARMFTTHSQSFALC